MMEQSSRFISLSGLSGIVAGLTALSGSLYAYWAISSAATLDNPSMVRLDMHTINHEVIKDLIFAGIMMLVVAISFGVLLTYKKANKKGQSLWSKTSKRLLINLCIPLVTGGLFALILIKHELFGLVAPTTLMFYGLALINASKYTLHDIRYLGLFEIFLGLISSYFIGYGLLFWALGFGLLHIIYGATMYFKYDRS
ncbi:MAG: hypothetical protein DWP98_09985 [Bacteroidetes bacterium]|nr:MAG: hypothetical protein DWP98_09985 [Bacteroidota bacterium]